MIKDANSNMELEKAYRAACVIRIHVDKMNMTMCLEAMRRKLLLRCKRLGAIWAKKVIAAMIGVHRKSTRDLNIREFVCAKLHDNAT